MLSTLRLGLGRLKKLATSVIFVEAASLQPPQSLSFPVFFPEGLGLGSWPLSLVVKKRAGSKAPATCCKSQNGRSFPDSIRIRLNISRQPTEDHRPYEPETLNPDPVSPKLFPCTDLTSSFAGEKLDSSYMNRINPENGLISYKA